VEWLSAVHIKPAVWTTRAIGIRLAVLIAASWFVLLFATFGTVLGTIDWNADVASTLTIGEFFPHVPSGATVTLASYPWYATLWFELVTRQLPFHREIWEVSPWLGSVAAVGLLSWVTAKVAGWWAAGLVALLLVCAGKNLLLVQFAPSEHGTVVWYACLLNAFLVLLVARSGKFGHRWVTHVVLSTLVAAVAAVGTASDKLLYLGGLVPFLLAGLVVARLAARPVGVRIALTTVGVAVGAVVGSRIVVAAMEARDVVAGPYPITFTTTNRLGQNTLDALQSVFALFNGTFEKSPVTARSTLALACAVLTLAALVVAARFAIRWTSAVAGRLARGEGEGRESLLRTAHVSFWLAAAALPLAAFVLTSVAVINSGRYLLSTAYGTVVLVVVAVAGSSATRRAVVTFAACVVAFASVLSLGRDFDSSPGDQMARELFPFVEGEGLTYGYGAYWVAVPLTWKSHGRIHIAPVVSCPKAPHGLCAYYNHTISSWYDARPHVRSFLIVDRRYGPPPPGKRLGGTVEVLDFAHFSVYVYDYDIASNIARDWWRYVPSDVVAPLQ
jgi:hypothetical protein